MANLSKVVKLTQEQYNTLASGGTVGDYTGLDPTFLYLVEDMGDIIDVSNGVTAEIRDYLIAHPATLLKYGEYIYVAQYTDGTLGSDAPTYYNCFEGDGGDFHYLVIDWTNLTIENEEVYYLKTTETAYDSTRLGGHLADYFINTSSAAQTKSGNLTLNGITDVSGGTLKLRTINAPTASGGTTYGPGSNGQVLKSNGTTIYWATDTNSNQTVKVGSTTFGADDAIDIVGTAPISVTANTTNKTITIAASEATTSVAGLMSAADKVKLSGIAAGAEVNVQSDWNVTDTNSDAFIKNKPTIPVVTNYYWADVQVSASSNKGTAPTVDKITIGGSGSTAGKATMQYNATEDCIDFVFA